MPTRQPAKFSWVTLFFSYGYGNVLSSLQNTSLFKKKSLETDHHQTKWVMGKTVSIHDVYCFEFWTKRILSMMTTKLFFSFPVQSIGYFDVSIWIHYDMPCLSCHSKALIWTLFFEWVTSCSPKIPCKRAVLYYWFFFEMPSCKVLTRFSQLNNCALTLWSAEGLFTAQMGLR